MVGPRHSASGVWLVVFALLTATPDSDPLAVSRGRFGAADFEGALAILDRALPAETKPHRRALLELERARCLSALRRPAESDGAIERALSADPTVGLAEEDATRALRATFAQVKTRLAAEVTIVTEPPGLAVRLDGAVVGRAPVTQPLPVGAHALAAIDESGTDRASLELVVAPRQKQTVVLRVGEPPALVERPPPVESPPTSWSVLPFVAARAHLDPLVPGVSLEPSLGLLGRHFLAELSVVVGPSVGLGARAGGRLPFAGERFSVQLTANGIYFLGQSSAPGVGVSAGFVVRAVPVLELFAEGALWYVAAAPTFRSLYGLATLGLRLRWPAPFEG